MRTTWTLAVSGFVVLSGWSVLTAEKPPETFQKAMKDMGAALQAANAAIKEEKLEVVSENAGKIVDAFIVVEKFFQGKNDDGVKLAQTASKSASDLRVAANLQSAEGVAFSNKELMEGCAACHAAHREKMPDGTFMIK